MQRRSLAAEDFPSQATLQVNSGNQSQNINWSNRVGDALYSLDSTLAAGVSVLIDKIKLNATRQSPHPDAGFNIQFDNLDFSIHTKATDPIPGNGCECPCQPQYFPTTNCCPSAPTCCQPLTAAHAQGGAHDSATAACELTCVQVLYIWARQSQKPANI